MAESAPYHDNEPRRSPVTVATNESSIANAIIAALRPEMEKMLQSELQPILKDLQSIKDTQEQHTKLLTDIRLDIKGVNKVLADNDLIPDHPDEY